MFEDIFDAIIVGAGLAGSVAALVLAREGAQSVSYRARQFRRCQRTSPAGVSMPTVWEHIIPGFADSAP